ncbi:MAG TPA: hypothetical protein P5081_19860 [Phycisphaerae bacterium]|nr:hypothetical protein [Phycisphaerae bacterium]HRW55134.1 hypothetical protein [Phycisphaerae bacterium]
MTDTPQDSQGNGELVPAELPPVCDAVPPSAGSRLGWFSLPLAPVLWFFPRTMGWRMASAGWGPAIAAHLLSVVYAVGLMLWATSYPNANPVVRFHQSAMELSHDAPPPLQSVREIRLTPMTICVTEVHTWTALGWGSSVIGVVVAIEGGVLLFALALAPFAAAGERTGRLFGRCLRLVMWSTTMGLPLGVGFMLAPLWQSGTEPSTTMMTANIAGISLVALWWFVVLIRSAMRYVGPAEGPGWEPRTPLCEECGYRIALIPMSSNCPECGQPVELSAPNRRQPPVIDGARGVKATFVAWRRMQLALIRERDYFRTLAIHRSGERDRLYFFISAAVFAIPSAGVVAILSVMLLHPLEGAMLSMYIVAFVALVVLQVILSGGVAVVLALTGRRSMQSSAIFSIHCLPIVQRLIVAACALAVCGCGVLVVVNGEADELVIGAALMALCSGAVGAILSLRSCRWFRSAVVSTRIANA